MEKHILLLHGALGSQEHFDPILPHLSAFSKIHRFNFYGHGGEKIPGRMLMPDLVEQTKTYIHTHIPAESELHIFGYSMGGYAALLLAAENSLPVHRVITLGTKLAWNADIAKKEITMLNPDVLLEKVPAYAAQLEKMHGKENWKPLLHHTAEMMKDLGEQQYLNEDTFKNIQVPCKLMLGDKDKMVSLDETLQAHRQIKTSALAVLPATPHPIEKLDTERWAFELTHS